MGGVITRHPQLLITSMNLLFRFGLLLLFPSLVFGRVSILNGLTQVHKLQIGRQISGKLVLKNESSKEARVVVYKQDLMAQCGEQVGYFPVNSHKKSMAAWVKSAVDERILGPNEEYTLFYTIDVPNQTIENGSYWSILMLEAADPLQENQTQGVQVNSVIRYAVQLIGEMGTMEYPPLGIEKVDVDRQQNAKTLVVSVRNNGIFSTLGKIQLEVYNEKQEKVRLLQGVTKRIYPSFCNQFEVDLTELKKGKYECILIIDNGRDLFGSTVNLEL